MYTYIYIYIFMYTYIDPYIHMYIYIFLSVQKVTGKKLGKFSYFCAVCGKRFTFPVNDLVLHHTRSHGSLHKEHLALLALSYQQHLALPALSPPPQQLAHQAMDEAMHQPHVARPQAVEAKPSPCNTLQHTATHHETGVEDEGHAGSARGMHHLGWACMEEASPFLCGGQQGHVGVASGLVGMANGDASFGDASLSDASLSAGDASLSARGCLVFDTVGSHVTGADVLGEVDGGWGWGGGLEVCHSVALPLALPLGGGVLPYGGGRAAADATLTAFAHQYCAAGGAKHTLTHRTQAPTDMHPHIHPDIYADMHHLDAPETQEHCAAAASSAAAAVSAAASAALSSQSVAWTPEGCVAYD